MKLISGATVRISVSPKFTKPNDIRGEMRQFALLSMIIRFVTAECQTKYRFSYYLLLCVSHSPLEMFNLYSN